MANHEIERFHETVRLFKLTEATEARELIDQNLQLEQVLINEILQGLETNASEDLEIIHQHPQDYLHYSRPEGKSRPFLSSYFAQFVAQGILNTAEQSLKHGDIPGFIARYDYTCGMLSTLIAVHAAEYALAATHLEEDQANAAEFTGSIFGLEISEKARIYLAEIDMFDSFKKLLVEDPTGFTLVDEIVKADSPDSTPFFKNDTNLPFEKAGANFGARLYKEIYKALEPLYS